MNFCGVVLDRLFATAGSWFLWDFSFYGNKVFQSAFINILSPGASILTTLLWTLLNSGCALVGYYVSAALVDNPKVLLRADVTGASLLIFPTRFPVESQNLPAGFKGIMCSTSEADKFVLSCRLCAMCLGFCRCVQAAIAVQSVA